MDEDYITFDRSRFKTVVHYIISQCDPDTLGNVKLHKILYFSDMIHFVSEGQPLTGVDYLKQQFGPVARNLSWALAELAKQGDIVVQASDYFGFEKKNYESSTLPDMSRFGNDQIALLNDVIDYVCRHSAREISDLSHNIAWEVAELGERIPYAAAMAFAPSEFVEDEGDIAEARSIRAQVESEREGNSLQ